MEVLRGDEAASRAARLAGFEKNFSSSSLDPNFIPESELDGLGVVGCALADVAKEEEVVLEEPKPELVGCVRAWFMLKLEEVGCVPTDPSRFCPQRPTHVRTTASFGAGRKLGHAWAKSKQQSPKP
jgi:hypothetical protein